MTEKEKIEFEGEARRFCGVRRRDVIEFTTIGGDEHLLFFDKGFLMTKFPNHSSVKVTIELLEEQKSK